MHGVESDNDVKSDINVIPLIDVMLVLLIIFMITAPHLQQSLKVDLPKAKSTVAQGKGEHLVITIDKQGTIYIGSDNPILPEEIGERVKSILDLKPEDERKVFIKADKDSNYGNVMIVLGELVSKGITDINLVAAPVK